MNNNNLNNRPRRKRNINNEQLRLSRKVRNNRILATVRAKNIEENIKDTMMAPKNVDIKETPITEDKNIKVDTEQTKPAKHSNILNDDLNIYIDEQILDAQNPDKPESTASRLYNKHVKTQIPKVIIFVIAIITVILFAIFAHKYANENMEVARVNSSVNQVVNKYIEDIQANYSTTVQNNPIAENDVVVFDLVVYYDGQSYDDNPVKQRLIINTKEATNDVESKIMNALIGKKVKDNVKVTIDAENQSFTQAVFDIKILNVYKLNDINDELVKKFVKENVNYIDQDVRKEFSEITTVDQLRAYLTKIIKDNLKQQELAQQNQGME